jgi:hypothetical protein
MGTGGNTADTPPLGGIGGEENRPTSDPLDAPSLDSGRSDDGPDSIDDYTPPSVVQLLRERIHRELTSLINPNSWELVDTYDSQLRSQSDRLRMLVDRAAAVDIDISQPHTSVSQADRELNRAKQALFRSDVVLFWRHFAEAKRWELVALEDVRKAVTPDDEWVTDLLDLRAHDVSLQLADILPKQRYQDVAETLVHDGSYDGYYRNIVSAVHILHRQHINDHLESVRVSVLESQLRFFLSVVALCLAAVFVIWMVVFDRAAVGPEVDPFSTGFIATVILFGALGAAISSLMSLSRVLKNTSIPEQFGSLWVAVSRVIIGAASALIVYVFVLAEIVQIFLITASSLLAIAFVAGFTERLLVKAVEAIANDDDDVARTKVDSEVD